MCSLKATILASANTKIKHRIHEGMWQVLYSQLGGF